MKWPGKIKPNSVSKEVISQIDIMATLAAITKLKLPKNAAPDSYDITPVILWKNIQYSFKGSHYPQYV